MKYYLLTTLMILIAIGPAPAQDIQTGKKQDQFELNGVRELDIALDAGFTVEIRGKDTDTLSYTYSFEGNKLAFERNFNKSEIKFDRHGTRASFRIYFPKLEDMKEVSWIGKLLARDTYDFNIRRQRLVLTVPSEIAVNFHSRYSNVDVSGIQRAVSIHTRGGQVQANSLGSNLQVENEYGTSRIENIRGNVTLDSRSSKETVVANITGSLRINSYYSNLRISQIDSDVEIQNRSGEILIDQVKGAVEINGDYTKIRAADITNNLNIKSKNGKVTARNLRSLTVSGEYTDIDATTITGTDRTNIEGRSSTVKLADVRGPAAISGEYLTVELNKLQEDVEISNRSGSVTGSSLEGAVSIQGEYVEIDLNNYLGSRIEIHNRSSDVRIHAVDILSVVNIEAVYGNALLVMEKEFSGRYHLEARYGEITTDIFPTEEIEVPERFNRGDGALKILDGIKGNDESHSMVIKTQNGDIIVNRK